MLLIDAVSRRKRLGLLSLIGLLAMSVPATLHMGEAQGDAKRGCFFCGKDDA